MMVADRLRPLTMDPNGVVPGSASPVVQPLQG